MLVAETHSFPEPDALEALLERHREPWTVVGPAVRNGNPGSAISWANVLMDYGSQLPGTPVARCRGSRATTGQYKRAALLELGDDLEQLIGAGDVLNDALVARGGHLYFEAKAQHGAFQRLAVRLVGVANGSPRASFAGYRARDWRLSKRAAYACGCAADPVRAPRANPPVRRPRRALRPVRGSASTRRSFAGLVLSAFGELVGYVAGVGLGRAHDLGDGAAPPPAPACRRPAASTSA